MEASAFSSYVSAEVKTTPKNGVIQKTEWVGDRESTLDSRFIKTADFVDSLARLSCTSETAAVNRVQEILNREIKKISEI